MYLFDTRIDFNFYCKFHPIHPLKAMYKTLTWSILLNQFTNYNWYINNKLTNNWNEFSIPGRKDTDIFSEYIHLKEIVMWQSGTCLLTCSRFIFFNMERYEAMISILTKIVTKSFRVNRHKEKIFEKVRGSPMKGESPSRPTGRRLFISSSEYGSFVKALCRTSNKIILTTYLNYVRYK